MSPDGWSLVFDLARQALRAPFVQVRLLLQTSDALPPFIVVFALLTTLWLQDRRPARPGRVTMFHAATVLVAVGLVLWFLQFGRIDWNQQGDWAKDFTYYSAAKQAVTNLEVPYYLPTARQGTERFLANLETNWAPHVILLRWMDQRTFFTVHAATFALAGSIAAVALSLEWELSSFSLGLFLVIFLLNGHVVSHLLTGHTQWIAYYLLPCAFLFLARMSKDKIALRDAIGLALTQAAMIAGGGWHVFVWTWLFAAVWSLRSRDRVAAILKTSLMVAGLAAYRLLPGVATFGGGTNEFLGGYSPWLFISALLGGYPPGATVLEWHEYDLFISWLGIVLLIAGSIPFVPSRRASDAFRVPSFVLIALSLFNIYGQTLFRLPGFVSERVATRLAIVGVLGLVLSGLGRVEQWSNRSAAAARYWNALLLIAGWFLAVQLVLRAQTHRPVALVAMAQPALEAIKPMPVEDLYWWSVWLGLGITVVAGLAVLRVFFWPRRSAAR